MFARRRSPRVVFTRAGRARALVAAGAAVALAQACRDRPVDPVRPHVASVSVTLAALVLRVGDTLTARVHAADSTGRAVVGREAQWRSSDERVATVSRAGLVHALAPGVVVVSADVGGARGAVSVQVVRPPAATVVLSPDSIAVPASVAVDFVAVARDDGGREIPGVAAAWASSAPAVVTVDSNGRAIARAPGRAIVSATVDGATGTAVLVVTRPSSVQLASVVPARLTPGATFTITGSGFSPNRASNAVIVGGVPATVRSATTTQIVATVAPTGYPCAPTRDAPVAVTVAGESGVLAAVLQIATQRVLAPGQSLVVADPAQAACNELAPASGEYVVAVFNPSTVQAAVPFALRVSPSEAPPFARAARSVRPTPDARSALGDTVAFRVLGAAARTCADAADDVRARSVYVGRRVELFEDLAAPLAGTLADDYRRIGEEFDDVTLPMIEAAFGNPLAVDARLARTGRVALLFTRAVNDRPGAIGLSYNCDLLPASVARASNERAIVYLAVPTSSAPGLGDGRATGTREAWHRRIRAVAAHEAKHVASYAERIARAAPFEEQWLEEGTALVAEELFGRAVRRLAARANTRYAESLACELDLFAPCRDGVAVFADHFARLGATLAEPASLTPLVTDPSVDPGGAFYGAAWWLLRWSADHHGAGDAPFFRALVAGPQTGVDNLAARAGRPWPELLGEWWLATALDDRPGFDPARATLTAPSWNLRDVLAGARASGDARFARAGPVAPRALPDGDVTLESLGPRGGGAAFFELSASAGARRLVDLRAPLGIAIVRLR